MNLILFVYIAIIAVVQSDFVVSDDDEVTFELYTLKNPSNPQMLSLRSLQSITSSNFDRHIPTRIYIHGWQEWHNMKLLLNDGYKTVLFEVSIFVIK